MDDNGVNFFFATIRHNACALRNGRLVDRHGVSKNAR